MQNPQGKLFAIGGAEDKGSDFEKGEMVRNNLNFFELGATSLRKRVALA
jgi:cyanophycinase